MNRDSLVRQVRERFQSGKTNGFLMKWEANRFHEKLKALCEDFRVVNQTDFNYSYCNSYEIEPYIHRTGGQYVLTVKFSFIADVFSVHLTKYSHNRKVGFVVPEHELPELPRLIRDFAIFEGFEEIDGVDHNLLVDGVELELSQISTLGKCLFDDFE